MPALVDQGLCIRCWEWSESSQTAIVFGRQTGLLHVLAKGSRRPRAPYSGGLEALTRGEMTVILKPAGVMSALIAWDVQESFAGIRRSLSGFYSAMYLGDLARHALAEGDPHPALWDALVDALRSLGWSAAGPETDRGSVSSAAPSAGVSDRVAVLRFQWAVLVETGYRPRLDEDVIRGGPLEEDETPRQGGRQPATIVFLPRLGGFSRAERIEPARGPAWQVRWRTLRLVRRLADRGDIPPDVSPADVERASRLLAAYLRDVLGREIPSMTPLFGSIRT